MAQAAAPEVDAHPEIPRFVREHVHIVIAPAHGPELAACLGLEPVPLVLPRHGPPGGRRARPGPRRRAAAPVSAPRGNRRSQARPSLTRAGSRIVAPAAARCPTPRA